MPRHERDERRRRLVDEERFVDADSFVSTLSGQALRRWTEIVGEVQGRRLTVAIRMRRRPGEARWAEGAVLSVAGTDERDADIVAEVCERVAASLSRGSFPWSSEPQRGWGCALDAEAALAARAARRGRYVLTIALAMGTVGGAAVALAGAELSALATDAADGGAVKRVTLVTGGLILLSVLAARRRLLPAVELAHRTPGRRVLQRVTRGVGVSTVLSFGSQILSRLLAEQ